MKTLVPAAIRCSLMFTGVAALSLAYPASVQAVPTTCHYKGNPFTYVEGFYTTSMFVTAMVTLARPLGANIPLTEVTPTAFTLSDGVQTINSHNANRVFAFEFATDASGTITSWLIDVRIFPTRGILTEDIDIDTQLDEGFIAMVGIGQTQGQGGQWSLLGTVPDAGSTLSLMMLTLMALGLVARRFQRAAG